jgi:hypothetical protein
MLGAMAGTRGARPFARGTLRLGLGFYLLFLAVSPLLHHDLECHLKTPSHCGACMASPPGLGAAAGAPLDATHLQDAGSVKVERALAPEPTFAVDAPGRSPPA